MIVIMKPGASREATAEVIAEVERLGFSPRPIYGDHLTVVAVVGKHPGEWREHFNALPTVDRVVLIDQSYKLVARAEREPSVFRVGQALIGGPELVVMAGPCAVEGEAQIRACAKAVAEAGGQLLRGGAFKPRTSPYSFQGLGEDGLKMLRAAADEYGLAVVSEVMDPRHVELCAQYVEMLQIGARNMQNFVLLAEVGRAGRAVALKRGMSATIDELLNAAEYVASGGTERVLLVERGIRTYEQTTRNTLDIAAVPVLKKLSHLPVMVDPSHGTGVREFVPPAACAAVAVGADALMIEIHPEPATAVSDGAQSLDFAAFAALMERLRAIPRYQYSPASVPVAGD